MNRSTKTSVTSGVIGAAAILLACNGAAAQATDAAVKARQEANRKLVQQPIRYARSVRPPVIDLEAMAKERRPGQVMPGDPYVSGAVPFGARPDDQPLALPNTGKATSPKVAQQRADVPTLAFPKPVTPQPTSTDAAPAPSEEAAPQPTQAQHAIVHEPQPTASAPAPAPEREFLASATPAPLAHPSAEPAPAESAPAPVATIALQSAAQPSAPAPSPVASIPIVSPPAPATAPPSVPAVAAGIDALLVDNISAPMSTESAKVVVAELGGVMSEAQWRTADSAWRQPRAGESLDGKIEVRAGINGEVTLVIDNQVQVTVSRLGRIVIERALEQGGSVVPTIALARGAIDIRPVADASVNGPLLVRVRTPDQAFGVRNAGAGGSGGWGLRVEYDAFSGTRRRASNP